MHPAPINLSRHIATVLIVKTALLYGLWAAFFSDPTPVDSVSVGRVVAGDAQLQSEER